MPRIRLRKKHVYWTLFVLHFFLVDAILVRAVRWHLPIANTIHFVDTSPLEVLAADSGFGVVEASARRAFEAAQPFEEVDVFDEDALSFGQFFTQMGAEGALVFDANADGLLDVYLAQDGQNWTRPTDESGVLLDKPRLMANVLYLNQGNDASGRPILVQVGDLVGPNDENAYAELLIEGFLEPRQSSTDSKDRPGRSSDTALAVDVNGDGRLDILVGNAPSGMFWSHEETRRVMPQFVNPIGREARQAKLPMTPFGQFLVQHTAKSSLNDKRPSSRGEEFEGANSLFLNLGDSDGDGIPEWEDASRRTGIEGFRHTTGLAAADIDQDGDLDIFCANLPDLDYWPAGSRKWAGAANCLYVNQLAQTGELRFVEQAGAMDVDGIYDEDYPMPDYWRLRRVPFLAPEYSLMAFKMEPYQLEYLVIDGVEAEHGELSHATLFQDVNEDGYPDIWVANDFGILRLYLNEGGRRFQVTEHARSSRTGYWMSFAPGDYDGDLREDLFVGNLGGSVMNNATVPYVPFDLFEPTMQVSTISAQFLCDGHDSSHAMIDGADYRRELPNRVRHSQVLPPDVALPNNFRRTAYGRKIPADQFDPASLDPYEFAWGTARLDVQNDGRPDFYWHGGLYMRGGGVFSILGTNPGRLMLNESVSKGELRFADATAEHHLFNIEEMRYDHLREDGFVWRPSPRQNWGKRDRVTSYDRSVWSSQGPSVQERVINQDLIQAAENGRAAIAADLNGDGALDLLIRNKGGYDSRSSKAVNLKVRQGGRAHVLPAHDCNYPTPTNFEPGRTRLFLNRYSANNWLKVELLDDRPNQFNRLAVGARVIVNDEILDIRRAGEGSFASNHFAPLHFGLGSGSARVVEVHWPGPDPVTERYELQGRDNQRITISRSAGVLD